MNVRVSAFSGLTIAALAALACSGRDDAARSDSARPGVFTVAEFQQLRWLDGRWRGQSEDGKHFYEQYRFVDDSTIRLTTFADSSFSQSTDSSRILLRNGTLANEGGASRWVAERLDTLGVEFAPDSGATNYFAWSKENPNAWKATLRWIDREGKAQRAEYGMTRLSP